MIFGHVLFPGVDPQAFNMDYLNYVGSGPFGKAQDPGHSSTTGIRFSVT